MCFSQEMSGIFSVIGLAIAWFVWTKLQNVNMTIGVLYFVGMEALQFFQYMWIDQCDSSINQWLTVVGFAHICFQPYFTHLMNYAMFRNPIKIAQGQLIGRLCLLQAVYMFSRWVFVDMETLELNKPCADQDWINGQRLCTYMGNFHLAWELPLHSVSYFWPSNNIHLFMMFAPFLATFNWKMILPGALLFFSGPYLSGVITDNLHEQASIWCFFSICQIFLLVVYSYYNKLQSDKNHLKKTEKAKSLKAQ